MNEPAVRRVALPTGVELEVAVAGDPANPPVVLLHGFPESWRTWRHQIPALAADHYVIAPNQRGYAGSSRPEGVEHYTADALIGDIFALADAMGIGRFTLVGHDWGGAIAWAAALRERERIHRLIILNAPHPQVFQRKLLDDMPQRAASQYIRVFRDSRIDAGLATREGQEKFFDNLFVKHLSAPVSAEERAIYLDQWSQPGGLTPMLNWYRATGLIVPAMDEHPERPAWIDGPFPLIAQPTLVVWGMADNGLLPCLTDGLDRLIPDYTLVQVPDGGHFVPWERPDAVTRAMLQWLAKHPVAAQPPVDPVTA
ncbi:MAG: alpha/beta fold hydrolase [Pseudomonadota bacterium]